LGNANGCTLKRAGRSNFYRGHYGSGDSGAIQCSYMYHKGVAGTERSGHDGQFRLIYLFNRAKVLQKLTWLKPKHLGLQLVSAKGKEIPVIGYTILPECLAELRTG